MLHAPLANTVAVVSNLEERCRAAFEPVNRDLARTGYPHLVMEPVNLSVHGEVYFAGVIGQGAWSGSDEGMHAHMDEAELISTAANGISCTLTEVLRVHWPYCADHSGPPMYVSVEDLHWWCRKGHSVARVGDLRTRMTRR